MSTLPKKVKQVLKFYANHITGVSPGEWRIRFEHSPELMHTWQWDEGINGCGAALVDCPAEFKKDHSLIVNRSLVYPATHAAMRELFERFNFGWDEFHSVIDGKHPEKRPNTPARVRARRVEALRIFDAMGEECPAYLSRITRCSASISFSRPLERKRAGYWMEEIWKLYERCYAREDPAKIHDTGPATKKNLMWGARNHNFYIMGFLAGY